MFNYISENLLDLVHGFTYLFPLKNIVYNMRNKTYFLREILIF